MTPWKYWWQSLSVFNCLLHTGTELGAPPSVSSSQLPHFISVLLLPFYRREAGGEGLSNLPQVQKTGWGRCGADLGRARGAPHCYGMLPPNQCPSGIPPHITDIRLFVPFLVFKRLYEQTKSSLNETALLRYNWCIIIYTYWKCTIWEISTCLHSTCDTHTHTHTTIKIPYPSLPRESLCSFVVSPSCVCFSSPQAAPHQLAVTIREFAFAKIVYIPFLAWFISVSTAVLRPTCAAECLRPFLLLLSGVRCMDGAQLIPRLPVGGHLGCFG